MFAAPVLVWTTETYAAVVAQATSTPLPTPLLRHLRQLGHPGLPMSDVAESFAYPLPPDVRPPTRRRGRHRRNFAVAKHSSTLI